MEHLHDLPSDLRNRKTDDYMPPTEEYSETFSESDNSIIQGSGENSSALEKIESVNDMVASGIEALKKTKMDRVDMENYVVEQSKRLASLAIDAVEGMQSNVVLTADGKLAQAYATLIGTASKALDTVNTIAQEHSRREHDIEMEEIKFRHKKDIAADEPKSPKNVSNTLNLIATREEIFKMLKNGSAGDVQPVELDSRQIEG